ncbi:enoyl-CoA hydratase/isomerase family protein [Halalkalibacter flavus]|uniref:enoyl-CoA hydratase/isomerase family protein n=1 Tax=Halalkalibacter flavus TaxID=3090668 RepID=UPI002FC628D4
MKSNKINLGIDGPIATITINRPEKKNALTDEMFLEIIESIERVKEYKDCKIVVIRGVEGVFCAGRDISSFQRIQKLSTSYEIRDEYDLPAKLNFALRNCHLPTVAVVQGYAMGVGAGLVSWCDVALVDKSAKFSYSEIKLGLAPSMVCVELLRNVPKKKAVDLLLTGKVIDAIEALSIGLITSYYSSEIFEQKVREYIEDLVSKSKTALIMEKSYLRSIEDMDYQNAVNYGIEISSICTASEEAKEKIDAFLSR